MQKATNITKTAVAAIMLLVVIQTLLAIKQDVFNGALGGSDVYMWLNRVLQIYETGDWQNHVLPRVDPPVGYEQHWTRPFDALLFSGALIGSLVTDFGNALYAWSALISPVLEILALLALLWGLSPLLKDPENEILGFLFVTQVAVLLAFVAGRADHQSLIFLLFITSLGLGLRILMGSFKRSLCIGAGLVSALAIWVSVESTIFSLATIIGLGVFWLLGEKDMQRKLLYYSGSVFLLLIAMRAIEYGWARLFEPVFDQISFVYIALFGLIFAFWFLINHFSMVDGEKVYPLRRFGIAALGATTTTFILHLFFPGILAGPLANVDELFRRIHLENISELQPAISLSKINQSNWAQFAASFLYWLGIIIPGIPALVYLAKKNSGPKRNAWIYILIIVLIYLPMAFKEIRWVPYVAILMLPGYAWLVATILQWIADSTQGALAGILRITTLVASVVIFVLPGVILSDSDVENVSNACPLIPISSFLNESDRWEGETKYLLAFTDYGPELLYRTRHSVFSIPSHRPHAGYTDSYNIMTALKGDQALQIIRQRQIDLILICPDGPEARLYAREDDMEIFHQRLVRGDLPPWLTEISLPPEPAKTFKLYSVNTASRQM